ncbi:MAG: CHC2 zinc finger domain-containing protein [Acidimicrobiales bacterium]
MTPVDRVLDALEAHGCTPTRDGSGWRARCPAHDDQTPSLSINHGAKTEVVFHCFGGCSPQQILQTLNLEFSDLFGNPRAKGEPREVARYTYCDVDGRPLYAIVRREPKHFSTWHPVAPGRWERGRGTSPKIPYKGAVENSPRV